jgi:hypothetical protein
MSPGLEMKEAKVVVGILFGWEKVTKHVVLECYKVLTESIHKIITCTFFQSEVKIVIDNTFDRCISCEFGLVEVLGDKGYLDLYICYNVIRFIFRFTSHIGVIWIFSF